MLFRSEVLKERKEQLFEYFGIKDFAHKQIKELSTGMKQKAAIAVSLVSCTDQRTVDRNETKGGNCGKSCT